MSELKTYPNAAEVEALAGELYEIYCAEVGGKAWNGDPLPSWKEFRADPIKTLQSDAWVMVADKAVQKVSRLVLKFDRSATRSLQGMDPAVHAGREVESKPTPGSIQG